MMVYTSHDKGKFCYANAPIHIGVFVSSHERNVPVD